MTVVWTQSFSDCNSPRNVGGESIIQTQPHRVNQIGNVRSQTNDAYDDACPIALVAVGGRLPAGTADFVEQLRPVLDDAGWGGER